MAAMTSATGMKSGESHRQRNASRASILAAISRLEAGLNELKAKKNSRPPGDNSKRKKNDYRQERLKEPPAKTHDKEEREGQTSTGDDKKTTNGVETGHKNNGIPEPIKFWGCGRIRNRRSFCPEYSGNENRRYYMGPIPPRPRKRPRK